MIHAGTGRPIEVTGKVSSEVTVHYRRARGFPPTTLQALRAAG